MKSFFAALAMVSALLIVESRADDTAQWCVGNIADVHKLTEDVKAQSFPVRELDVTNTAIFLSHVKAMGFIENIPNIPGASMTILINPGSQIWGILHKGDKWCARLILPWDDYQKVVHAMRPKNI